MSFIGSKGRNTNMVVGYTRICRVSRKECSVRTSWESKELRENPSMSFCMFASTLGNAYLRNRAYVFDQFYTYRVDLG